ncbi:MAG: agmatine deiminase family protein, partial [Kangiellaceae bacterium]|nr:agmatine deiminase family protein [Kangiellaceae bacterium]
MLQDLETTKRWPAEWEPHARTWMAFPCREEIWSNGLETAQLAFCQIANLISEYEPLSMLVNKEHKLFATKKLNSEIDLIEMAFDDSWTRDTAPIWIREEKQLVALDFEFNGWGNKFFPYNQDQKIGQRIIEQSHSKGR